jgi:hypothetical protein
VRGLLIKKISLAEQQPFIRFVDEIFLITKSDNYNSNPQKRAQVRHIEEQINRMVNKLYDLTVDEIKTIEKTG